MGLVNNAHESKIPPIVSSLIEFVCLVANRQLQIPQQKKAIKTVSVRTNEDETIRLVQAAAMRAPVIAYFVLIAPAIKPRETTVRESINCLLYTSPSPRD